MGLSFACQLGLSLSLLAIACHKRFFWGGEAFFNYY